MPREVNGVQSVLAAARVVSRMVKRFGVTKMAAQLGPDLMAACVALEAAMALFEALDDQPGKKDHTPGGPGDDIAV